MPTSADMGGLRFGTLVETDTGLRPVQDLRPGDAVFTTGNELRPLIWSGHRILRLADQHDPVLRPVLIEADAFGPGCPQQRLMLAPGQLVALSGWRVELHFATPQVLVPAAALVDGHRIRRPDPTGPVGYIVLLLDGHCVIDCAGFPCGSAFPTPTTLAGLDPTARGRLLRLFPTLASLRSAFPRTALPVLTIEEAALLA